MGDRDNPIKFGPEWLRNLAGERSTASQGGNNSQSTGPAGGTGPSTRRGGGGAGDSFAGSSASQSSNGTVGVRVQLANLRYGREEMLALYEAAADPPHELTGQDLLYQPRGKPPFALSTSFEDEMRESLRSSTHTGGIPGERFSLGRGMGRGLASVPDNPRPRFRATGSTVLSRPSGEPPEAGTRPQLTQRNPRYQASDNKPVYFPTYVGSSNNMFRSKRQNNTTSTNWRSSQTRDGGEEWRSSEPGRPRTGQDRERDRDRPGDRPQSGSNRRSMSDHNDETIPEWAFANAEACGGTFDSSGAFHGYSSDDSSLPQKQDNEFSLSRSRTHNNIMRLKTVEEGSEEWWASEKAKKLSPKRFDAGDIKFKQGAGILDGPLNTMSQNSKSNTNREEQYEEPQKDSPPTSPELPSREPYEEAYNNKKSYNKQQFSESKPFDSMMRQDISVEEAHSSSANDQRGNFKSVMITPNNSLRTKHQNIVSSANETTANRAQGLMSMKAFALQGQKETDHHQQQTFEEKIIDDFLDMPLESHDIGNAVLMGPSSSSLSNNSLPPMHDRGLRDLTLQGSNIPNQTINNVQNMGNLGMQSSGLPQGVPNVGLNNPSMNQHVMSQMEFASNNSMGMPLQVPQGMMQNAGLSNHGMEGASMQRSGLPGFQTGGIPMGSSNVSNNSLFMGKNSGGVAQGDIPMPGHTGQGSMFPMHGLQHSGSQGAFSATVFNNLMQQSSQPPPAPNPPLANPLADQWYYEDPDKNTQGPFSSREMYTWYRAGFFTPSLMVRRACEREMRPLGSYGPLVPFVQMDVMPPFPMSGFESRAPMNQSGLGLGVINTSNNDKPIPMPPSAQNAMRNSLQSPMQSSVQTPTMPSVLPSSAQSPRPNAMLSPIQVIQNAIINQNIIQSSIPPLQANMQSAPQNGMQVFGNVGLNRNAALGQQNMFDSLWGQGSAQDVRWMHSNPPIASRVNNLPMYFWEPSAINSTSLLPEDITKEMKTEDQILAQLRAAQTISQSNATHTQPDLKPATSSATQMDAFSSPITATYFEELHKIIHKDTTPSTPASSKESSVEQTETQPVKLEKPTSKSEQTSMEPNNTKLQQTNSTKTESKPAKQTKAESEKAAKNKENNSKSKNKKKEEKKEDGDSKIKEDDNNKTDQKRSVESSPVKSKKEEKSNKKDLEKEKKEWIKEGFTIVKGSEKGVTKDTKKKSEEAKQIEEAERKRKEEEKLAAEEERKRKQTEHKKNQEQTQPQPSSQKQAAESAMKKAPWSASQAQQATSKDGLTLAEIQRLEREKKLEQMREQQQMMQIIAQQQAAALAREQEMQANLAWAKKKAATPVTSPSFAEIQAEQVSRKQASVAVVSPPAEEERPPAVNHTPWGNAQNGESPPWPTSGFWDSPVPQPPPPKAPEPKQQETKPEAPKPSKKKTPASSNTTAGQNAAGSAAFAKKVTTPAVEFETWCTTTLKSWSTKIDVPTFIGFLKDIESPYEVKDYVRCYLGETKDSGDFARQFLERRSKLLRVGMVTPSDDLCSPAMAVNPRSNSQSDYQEVKGKGKKPKKNKMLKVDARFLGFSATASEDRINVGDIDTV